MVYITGLMTPETSSALSLSGWAIRQRLEEQGHSVSDTQLDEFVRWGLLRRDENGYAPKSDERAIEILEAAREARSLPRRVVFLRGDFLRFPVPTEPLQRAFVEFAPTIKRPIRKMQQLEAAWRWMGARSRHEVKLPRRRGRLPQARKWADMLRTVRPEVFESWVVSWYYLGRDVLPAFGREIGLDLLVIPLEERVLIAAVLDQWTRAGSPPG